MAKSPEGKKTSSMNRMTHGVRSCVRLMKDEKQEDYDACERGWLAMFQPGNYKEQRLVDQLILNDWFLQRATRRLMEVEAGDREAEDYEHRLALMQRYKTTAERAFYRALSAVEGLRKEMVREYKELRREEAKAAEKLEKAAEKRANSAKQEQRKAGREIRLVEQWVEVRVDEEGKTVTELFPANEELREQVEALDPERDLVYRRFHFVNGVPEEYRWTAEGLKVQEHVREYGGAGIQRMRPGTWFAQIEREKREGGGHLLPCGGNVPRPEERGGCDCEVCAWNRELEQEEWRREGSCTRT